MAKIEQKKDLIIILKNTSYIVYTIPIIGVEINCLYLNNIGKLDAIN